MGKITERVVRVGNTIAQGRVQDIDLLGFGHRRSTGVVSAGGDIEPSGQSALTL